MLGRLFSVIIILTAFIVSAAGVGAQDDLTLGMMAFDKVKWGPVGLVVPVENHRPDTARVSVDFTLLFHEHYISGLERFTTDTSFYVPPLSKESYRVFFEMQPSYGQAVVQVSVSWRYDLAGQAGVSSEPVVQTFRASLKVPNGAAKYINKKFSAGPSYSLLDDTLISLDLGRIYLYLTARGVSRSEIIDAFEVDEEYLQGFHDRLVVDGFFSLPQARYNPRILAIAEEEGLQMRPRLQEAARMFSGWYQTKGQPRLDALMQEAGLDESVRCLPALQMGILLSLLCRPWASSESDYACPAFEDMKSDLAACSRPLWIMEGGEFLLPRLDLAVLEEKDYLNLTTLRPDPKLPYEKAAIFDLRKAIDEAGELPLVESAQLRAVIEKARQERLVESMAGDLKGMVAMIRPSIKKFKAYQAPYLADYVIRYVLGEYFSQHPAEEGWLDGVRVRY